MTKMLSPKQIIPKIMEVILHKYPLINALTLLMLFAERAPAETEPPIHPRIVYANLLFFLAAGLLMSSNIKRKEASFVFSGQLIYFAYNFYNNPKLHYKEWIRLLMSTRHVGCIGVYLMYGHILDKKKSSLVGRSAEILIGLFLFSSFYLINNTKEIRNAVLLHIVGGDWGRYVITVILAACALSFFSGYFLRDMSVCAAVAIAMLTFMVDCDFSFWSLKGLHFWVQARLIGDNLCVCSGLIYFYFHLDNKIKTE